MDWLFVESLGFTDAVVRFDLEQEYRELQILLMEHPRAGVVEPGSCGLRKIRVADHTRGQGKRFGARMHYLLVPHRSTIYMVSLYPKGVQGGLTPEQKKALCKWIRTIPNK